MGLQMHPFDLGQNRAREILFVLIFNILNKSKYGFIGTRETKSKNVYIYWDSGDSSKPYSDKEGQSKKHCQRHNGPRVMGNG